MRAFAALIEGLVFMPSRNGKLRLLEDYFAHAPDPDRGWALAALTDGLDFPAAKAGMIRGLAAERVDPDLFAWSYDYVGDLAETVSLIWPERPGANRAPDLHEVVEELGQARRADAPRMVERWLDALTATERYALIKLVTGGMRVGVSGRLAKTALARFGDRDVAEIEELWHGLEPPFTDLFAWLEGRADRPAIDDRATFRPLMLANPLDDADVGSFDIDPYRAEWKWDGIRVQLVARGGERRVYSRTGDDISAAFPDITEAMDFDAVLDGELLVAHPVDPAAAGADGGSGGIDTGAAAVEVASFNQLQQRLNRKTVSAKMLKQYPAWVRLYDILFDGAEDLRPLAFDARRARLAAWYDRAAPARMDLSAVIAFDGWDDLTEIRAGARAAAIEGLMLKRGDAAYVSGRPKGPWFKWKRDPLTVDAVLMYAQRGHGKRSSFYSDFTFGAWRPVAADEEQGPMRELVPVGKAYFGFTDQELAQLDKWVRGHTVDRYGPVRAVEPGLVLEIAFDSVHRSPRHKSGVAMRFPRVHRIRWDKPADEADRLETLEAMIVE
ncbi:MAG: cisplatin damage response ATP-dependent DNA ligase [Deinococcus-Thermus bacterium]|jgi:DNA ligase-1|nr:cisplatin damage response ATP-dependent DNA ligase [Deinococcota bacterium]